MCRQYLAEILIWSIKLTRARNKKQQKLNLIQCQKQTVDCEYIKTLTVKKLILKGSLVKILMLAVTRRPDNSYFALYFNLKRFRVE